MTLQGLTGFEIGEASAEGVTLTRTAAFSTVQARTGTRAIRCNPSSGATGHVSAYSGSTSAFIHFGLYIATLPSITRAIAGSDAASSNFRLNSDGTLSVYNGATIQGTSAAALSTATW